MRRNSASVRRKEIIRNRISIGDKRLSHTRETGLLCEKLLTAKVAKDSQGREAALFEGLPLMLRLRAL